MNEIRVRKARPIAAEIRVPGDKSISHRAVILASLANGPSVITGFLRSPECMGTVEACRALGAEIEFLPDEEAEFSGEAGDSGSCQGSTRLLVKGRSLKLSPPAGPVHCGASGTALTLLTGVLSGQPFTTTLLADEQVSKSAIGRIVEPLEAMGSSILLEGQWPQASITVAGRPPLRAIDYPQPMGNSQSVGAVLLAGLFAPGKTTILQRAVTRDHTERMLKHFQVKTLRRGMSVSIYGGQVPESRDFQVPGDISCAANWIVAAALQPESELVIRGVGLNETRTGFLRVLVRMGAQVLEHITGCDSEPSGTLIVRGAPLQGTLIPMEDIAEISDELALLAVAASMARGSTVIDHTPEESERLGRIAVNLRLMGVEVITRSRGIEIRGNGGELLQPGCVPSYGDRRIAMAFAVAGLYSSGETIVEETACIASAYPDFARQLRQFQSREISEGIGIPVISSLPFRRMPPVQKPLRETPGKPDDKPVIPRHG